MVYAEGHSCVGPKNKWDWALDFIKLKFVVKWKTSGLEKIRPPKSGNM